MRSTGVLFKGMLYGPGAISPWIEIPLFIKAF